MFLPLTAIGALAGCAAIPVMDGSLTLVETRPEPVAGGAPINKSDYVFGFRFTPRS